MKKKIKLSIIPVNENEAQLLSILFDSQDFLAGTSLASLKTQATAKQSMTSMSPNFALERQPESSKAKRTYVLVFSFSRFGRSPS